MSIRLSAIFKSCTTKKSFQISNKYNLQVNLDYESENNFLMTQNSAGDSKLHLRTSKKVKYIAMYKGRLKYRGGLRPREALWQLYGHKSFRTTMSWNFLKNRHCFSEMGFI